MKSSPSCRRRSSLLSAFFDARFRRVIKEERFLVASGKTVLEEGDIVLALVDKENLKEVQTILSKQRQKGRKGILNQP